MTQPRDSHYFRTPLELQQEDTPISRILVIGSCLMASLPGVIKGLDLGYEADYIVFNNVAQLPEELPSSVNSYDFQIVQIAARTVLPDGSYFRLSYDEPDAHLQLFEETVQRLSAGLDAILSYNSRYNIPAFVSNFLVPQINPYGRLLPRYDIRNPVFFFEELNRALDTQVRSRAGCYVIDTNAIAGTFGKRYIQDDSVWQTNHASALSDADVKLDYNRLETPMPPSSRYQLKTYEFVLAFWAEICAMFRTIMKVDNVKLVIIDLDDTLWRGVLVEEGLRSVEGWPLGFSEALLYLKKRGVVLAIASKNDEVLIESRFGSVFGQSRLRLEDFAVKKINWLSKIHSVGEIIREINVLPSSVVFIDDNPVERAAVSEAFPEVRVLGDDLYSTRRILLWSAECQVAEITRESSTRTKMVAAQIERESSRAHLSREDFLQSLDVRISLIEINDMDHPRFSRAAELVNKSNQFNTTGRRWTHHDWLSGFSENLRIFTFEVEDKYTEYGMVVVVIVVGSTITQFVMSCRVIGLAIEQAAMLEVCRRIVRSDSQRLYADYKATDVNHLCSDLFQKTGFTFDGEKWSIQAYLLPECPAHINIR